MPNFTQLVPTLKSWTNLAQVATNPNHKNKTSLIGGLRKCDMEDLRILKIKDECTGGGACVSVCKKNALSLQYDEEGFYYPFLNSDRCIGCGACERVCPVLNTSPNIQPEKKYHAYMLKANNKVKLKKSSSGGAFTLFAEQVLSNSGVIYGARYNYDKERLEHVSTDKYSLEELKKSKYIESFIDSEVFSDIEKHLVSGREVLFCGTPCQVKELRVYLTFKKIPLDKLFLVRFICHGVPSNLFFTEYKHYEEKKSGAKMSSIDFRSKILGWGGEIFVCEFENGKRMKGYFRDFYYTNCFNSSLSLRKSCYSCKQILDEDVADITIGDFWGIKRYRPEMHDTEGVSLVMIHSDKGARLLDGIATSCKLEELPISCLDYIYREVDSKGIPLQNRDRLMSEVVKNGYMSAVKQYIGKSYWKYKIRDTLVFNFRLLKRVIQDKKA